MEITRRIFGRRFKLNRRDPIRIFRQRALRANGLSAASHALDSNASIASLTTLLLTAVIVLGILIGSGSIPKIRGFTPEDMLRRLTISSNQESAREALLERMNQEQARKVASQIYFITEIIMKHHSKATPLSLREAHQFSASIVAESFRSGFDPLFVASIIKSESTFNPLARSRAGAVGLMQMLPSTGTFVVSNNNLNDGKTYDVNDPKHNIRLGILYLAYLRKIFHNDKEKMLIAYNWGPENARKAFRSNRAAPMSTIQYATRILSHYRDWSDLFESQASRYKHLDFERAAIEPATAKLVG